ncbi:VWA domain-containing protein [Sporosarcina sp. G11-34]|uniref:VWA domain-containing protein n=1 Tax=Sporosarcina sp. G11-34 TaxID=2849605 RepID=UPI0022A9D88C|nr:VWA domain-containing protein [Sporosarcina sp. G11-34]
MKRIKKDEKNCSVLNTDAFDKRRFKEIFEMSQGLQKLTHEAVLPTFEPLLGDIWASFYKMKPAINVKEVDGFLSVNKFLMEVIMADEYFAYHRNFTRLNDLESVISAIQFGEKINQWLAQQLEEDEDLREQSLKIQLRLGQMRKQQFQEADGKSQVDGMKELNEKLQQTILGNHESFLQAMAEARQESKQVEDGLKSLLGGIGAGNADAELKKVPLRDKILLAEKIASTKKMKEIAEWAGRFKQIARKKQKSKQSESVTRRGVTIGNDIENLLPVELCFYTHPLTKMDFLRRFAECETMQFEQKGPEDLKKGPIVLCLDQSDSMSSLDTQSKGFTLALMAIAKKQRRDLCLVLFSSCTQIFRYEKGEVRASEMTRLARTFLGGGTNFTLALDDAVHVINESRFKRADIVFVTDGEDQVTDSFLEVFNKKKQEKAFNVLSLVIGGNRNTVEQFTDRVIEVIDFDNEGSFTAFEV